MRHARKNGGDIPAAARGLGVPITEHHVAVQRAGALVPRIDTALAEVQRCGTMNFSMPSTGARPRVHGGVA